MAAVVPPGPVVPLVGAKPGLLESFDPPAALTDLRAENLPGWSKTISDFVDDGQAGNATDPYDNPRPQFFNATKVPIGQDFQTKDITWTAFPRQVLINAPNDATRWRRADRSRDFQDEYCEWSVTRNVNGKITRVTFTSEGPEYWKYLAKKQPETVLQLYREHISSAVQEADLFDSQGKYITRNKWNRDTTNGAMHLIQPNNTLSAEIELGAAATIPRLYPDGEPITDAKDLIACAKYGAPERFSDPFIGASVNELARLGAMITLQNPIALYIDSFQPVGFQTPDGTDASEFWTWTRGTEDFYLRGVFEVPQDKPYVVGDIKIEGKGPIVYGSMLADYIRIKLTGVASDINIANKKPVRGCVGDASPPSGGDVAFLAAPRAPLARAAPPSPSRRTRSTPTSPEEDGSATDGDEPATVLHYIAGINQKVEPMSAASAEALLKDPFAELVLKKLPAEDRPMSLDELSEAVMQAGGEGFREMSFMVGDGGHIPYSKFPTLERSFRFVWVRVEETANGPSPNGTSRNGASANGANGNGPSANGANGNGSSGVAPTTISAPGVDGLILAVAGRETSSKTSFLQLVAWDDVNRVFNFYARINVTMPEAVSGQSPWQWVYSGSSKHAFDEKTEGKGPFDGHVNGSLLMKELRVPWNNWHSSENLIEGSISDADPLRGNRFYQMKSSAQDLQELVVQPGIVAWTVARLDGAIGRDGSLIERPKNLLKHVLVTNTINLISSTDRSLQRVGGPGKKIKLPISFFCNTFALTSLGVDILDNVDSDLKVDYQLYRDTITKFGFELVGRDADDNKITIPNSDTFFAFLVPEPALEDMVVALQLGPDRVGLLSPRFLLCAFMVDYPNPVYSPVRLDLMQYVPDSGTKASLENDIVKAILAGATNGNAAAQEFKSWYDLPQDALATKASETITEYLGVVNAKCKEASGFEDFVRLAESRRNDFARRPLAEFDLTLPHTNIKLDGPLKMMPDGSVVPMTKSEAKAAKAATVVSKVKCEELAI